MAFSSLGAERRIHLLRLGAFALCPHSSKFVFKTMSRAANCWGRILQRVCGLAEIPWHCQTRFVGWQRFHGTAKLDLWADRDFMALQLCHAVPNFTACLWAGRVWHRDLWAGRVWHRDLWAGRVWQCPRNRRLSTQLLVAYSTTAPNKHSHRPTPLTRSCAPTARHGHQSHFVSRPMNSRRVSAVHLQDSNVSCRRSAMRPQSGRHKCKDSCYSFLHSSLLQSAN